MNLLDRLLGHDAWTTRQLLVLCRSITDMDLDREFDIGRRTLRATFEHVIRNMEVWTDQMAGRDARAAEGRSVSDLIGRLDVAAADLAALAREVESRDGWDEQWVDPLEDPPVARSYGGTIVHLVTHSMHHRAQILAMMRRLGIDNVPEGDALSWERQASGSSAM